MELQDLTSVLESILFVSNKPLNLKQLEKIVGQDTASIQKALDELVILRKNSGVVVLENSGEYQFATNGKHSEIVKDFLNTDLREKLTDATVEVLAIVAYRQPISKAEIEAIRGVNSQYSIRHLLMRGMIEKTQNPSDARGFLYQTTTEFLMHLGLNSTESLPSFEELTAQIKLPQTPQSVQAVSDKDQKEPEDKTVIIETKTQDTNPHTEEGYITVIEEEETDGES